MTEQATKTWPGTVADLTVGTPIADRPGGFLGALEAILMVADEPVSVLRLATALRLPIDGVHELLKALCTEYLTAVRRPGFELRESADGWRIYSAPAFADVVGQFVTDGQAARLSQAALETLAVIAYRQPVTRGQISAVRGVSVDGVVRTLTMRGLVVEDGTDPVSGATLYRTTGYFMERMGLTSLDELPALAPHLPEIDALELPDDLGRSSLPGHWGQEQTAEMTEQPAAPEPGGNSR